MTASGLDDDAGPIAQRHFRSYLGLTTGLCMELVNWNKTYLRRSRKRAFSADLVGRGLFYDLHACSDSRSVQLQQALR